MIMESLDEYLEFVAEHIFDNDKLVTYKWLSKELEVHVNIAKQILWEFWQRYKEEKRFDSTFLLMGVLHDDSMRVEVVKEKDLLTAKEKYNKVISEHIYSLQKVLSDIHLLGNTENGDIKYSAIKCFENNERSDAEMHALRWGDRSNEVQSVPQEKVASISEPIKPKQDVSPEQKQIDKKKNSEKKGFNNLFGKAINKQKSPLASSGTKTMEVDPSNCTKQASKDVPESVKKATVKGGLDSFLQQSKNHGLLADSPEKNKYESSTEKENTEKRIMSENNKKPAKNVRGKKRTHSKDTNNATKRRKRITIQSESSDTGSSDNEGQEEHLPSSPETVQPVKICSPPPPHVQIENGKRKVLKIVDKTFEEDGFLVTKKVHVYESCSEDESEMIESEKPVAHETHSEAKAKKNTKQTTLMTFFKKS
ncbi:DNA polymerase delta subunit 3 [Anthophora retusa]